MASAAYPHGLRGRPGRRPAVGGAVGPQDLRNPNRIRYPTTDPRSLPVPRGGKPRTLDGEIIPPRTPSSVPGPHVRRMVKQIEGHAQRGTLNSPQARRLLRTLGAIAGNAARRLLGPLSIALDLLDVATSLGLVDGGITVDPHQDWQLNGWELHKTCLPDARGSEWRQQSAQSATPRTTAIANTCYVNQFGSTVYPSPVGSKDTVLQILQQQRSSGVDGLRYSTRWTFVRDVAGTTAVPVLVDVPGAVTWSPTDQAVVNGRDKSVLDRSEVGYGEKTVVDLGTRTRTPPYVVPKTPTATVVVPPNGPGRVDTVPKDHVVMPPGRNVKEKKGTFPQGVIGRVVKRLGQINEGCEVVDAIYKTLPWQRRRWKGRDGKWRDQETQCAARAVAILMNFDALSVKAVVQAVLANEAEDRIIGKLSQGAIKGQHNAGSPRPGSGPTRIPKHKAELPRIRVRKHRAAA